MTEKRETAAVHTALSWLPGGLSRALCRLPVPLEEWTEIRLRSRGCVSVTCGLSGGNYPLADAVLTEEELREILARICRGSVHAYDEELRRGYLSAGEGIRVGVCGQALCEDGSVRRLRRVTSLCIRLPHPFSVSGYDGMDAVRAVTAGTAFDPTGAKEIPDDGAVRPHIVSTLFYAPPGCGKTTLLRHLIARLTAPSISGLRGAVVDTGEELYTGYEKWGMTDVFSAYPRGDGISLAVRAFSPQVLFCDEIGDEREADGILRAQTGGVPLIATAHAETLSGLLCRPCFAALHEHRVFARYLRVFPVQGGFSFTEECAETSGTGTEKENGKC